MNPNKAKNEEEMMKQMVEAAETAAKAGENMRGLVGLRKMGMMKPIPMVKGYYTVLPNARAKARGALVWAFQELSPKKLGPVDHKQPGLPPCANLENFHQFNKVFKSETDESGKREKSWYTKREKGYLDKEAHRHKLGATKADHLKKAGGKKTNACLHSVYVKPTGEEMICDYIQSRVFYCTFYDRLVRNTDSLQQLIDHVYVHNRNLIIAGYDARNEDDVTPDLIQKWYHDPTAPFGHELALVAILLLWHTPEELPWRKEAKLLDFEI